MTKIGIANFTEDGHSYRLVADVELRVGDHAGDLAERGFQTIEHEPVKPGTLGLSVTNEVINRRVTRGDAFVSAGPGLPELPDDAVYDEGWSAQRYAQLREIAERWHLNTMKAGCAHQHVEYETDRYGRRVPSLDHTNPCPKTGYRYGSAWLVEPLPDPVVAFVRDLGVEVSS